MNTFCRLLSAKKGQEIVTFLLMGSGEATRCRGDRALNLGGRFKILGPGAEGTPAGAYYDEGPVA
jgi:hypothetical protein